MFIVKPGAAILTPPGVKCIGRQHEHGTPDGVPRVHSPNYKHGTPAGVQN